MVLPIVALATGVLALWRRLRGAGPFLLIRGSIDVIGYALDPLRAGAAKPYTGAFFILWLVTDVALWVLSPALLLWLVGHRRMGAALWISTMAFVAWSYPGLRGANLVCYYAAVYVVAYTVAFLTLTWRSLWRGHTMRDESALMFVIGGGFASTLLVVLYGVTAWWSTAITNGAAYLATTAICLWPDKSQESSTRGRRSARATETRAR